MGFFTPSDTEILRLAGGSYSTRWHLNEQTTPDGTLISYSAREEQNPGGAWSATFRFPGFREDAVRGLQRRFHYLLSSAKRPSELGAGALAELTRKSEYFNMPDQRFDHVDQLRFDVRCVEGGTFVIDHDYLQYGNPRRLPLSFIYETKRFQPPTKSFARRRPRRVLVKSVDEKGFLAYEGLNLRRFSFEGASFGHFCSHLPADAQERVPELRMGFIPANGRPFHWSLATKLVMTS